ncbi:MAG: hypothetical protein LIO47_00405, partial [Akkermansia sp.]|nr:hypothetical protein [Akkermansia sp.]
MAASPIFDDGVVNVVRIFLDLLEDFQDFLCGAHGIVFDFAEIAFRLTDDGGMGKDVFMRGLGRRDDIDVFVAQDVLHVHPEDGPLLDFHVALDAGFQHDFIAGRQE